MNLDYLAKVSWRVAESGESEAVSNRLELNLLNLVNLELNLLNLVNLLE